MHLLDQQLNLSIRGQFDDAWKISEEINQQTPNDLRHLFNRAFLLIKRGDFQKGYSQLEAGRHINVYGNKKINTTAPIWQGEDLANKTVIINLEGGWGDQFIFLRFAECISNRQGKTILCCDRAIHKLCNRTPGVNSCITLNELNKTPHDYWIPSFSCSWLFGHDFSTLPNKPYIFPDENKVKEWENIIKSNKLKVGIRWSGNPQFEHQQFRIFPSDNLIKLKKYNIQLYSLQRDNDTRELPDEIIDLNELLISWEETAAAIANLDLIITSCTSIAHLASAMGKPCWVIVPILPYHIWAYGNEHTPWYQKTTRIFRQKKFSDWNETFDELETHLKSII